MVIYDLVLPEKDSRQDHIIILNKTGPGQQARALLQTSSQVRREASKIYFKRAVFWLHTGQGEGKLKEDCAYVRHVIRMCGPSPFKKFSCAVDHPVWDGLQTLRPFFDLLRETKLQEVFIYYDHLPYYVAHFFDYIEDIHEEVRRCLRRMMKVIKDARDRSWSKEKFERKFAGLVRELRDDAQDPFVRFSKTLFDLAKPKASACNALYFRDFVETNPRAGMWH